MTDKLTALLLQKCQRIENEQEKQRSDLKQLEKNLSKITYELIVLSKRLDLVKSP